MTVSYEKVKAKGSRKLFTDRMEWKDSKEEVHAYPLDAKAGMEDGGFEIEVVLNEKPDTNVFDFKIEGAEDLDFFYQPALTQEEIDGGASRPENVVGSYAVYHNEKKDHRIGGTDYATGKAYHIYRPRVIDAGGVEQWAALSYENGTLSITVPQTFLDDAAYPLRVDPTFGNTNIGATTGSIEDAFAGADYTLTAGTGVVSTLHAYVNVTTSNKDAIMAIYTSVADPEVDPNAVVANGTATAATLTTGASFRTFTLATPPTLNAGIWTLYINGELDTGSSLVSYDSGAGAGNSGNGSRAYNGAVDSSYSGIPDSNRIYSMYATYTLSPGATFGLTADNASTQTNSTDRKYVYSATPATSGTVKGGVARVWIATAGTASSTLVIYSDTAGEPDALLAASDRVTITNLAEAAQSYTFSGANQISITAGTPYWIGEFHSDPGANNFTYSRANNLNLVRSDPDTYSDGPANPCSCTTSSNGGLDIYIEYTETPAAAATPLRANLNSQGFINSGVIIN
jgi:hypothetical protein